MSDLIERLQRSMCDPNMGCGTQPMCLCAVVDEAMTHIKELQTRADYWESACEMAIEQKHEVSSAYKALSKKYRELEAALAFANRELDKRRQRIEKLEAENAEFRIECKNLAHQVGYEKQAKEYKQTRIEALEAALRDFIVASRFIDRLWLKPETREIIEGLDHE